MTEDKIVLKFLHDAFYYYLVNRGNTREHLNVSFRIVLKVQNQMQISGNYDDAQLHVSSKG